MNKEFWLNKWKVKQIGFHRFDINPMLIDFYDQLNLKAGDSIFVPLCGKSLDMLWLAKKGLNVIGIELSDIAIKEFFKENNLAYKIEYEFGMRIYKSEKIVIFQGDIFDLKSEKLGKVDAIYDRAATVALPFEMRVNYLKKLDTFMTKKNILMILFEYDQYLLDGPPFSVSESFIRNFYSNKNINKVKVNEKFDKSSKFTDLKTKAYEKVYIIKE